MFRLLLKACFELLTLKGTVIVFFAVDSVDVEDETKEKPEDLYSTVEVFPPFRSSEIE